METVDVNKQAEFEGMVLSLVENQGARSILMNRERLKKTIDEVQQAKAKISNRTSKDFRRLRSFDTLELNGQTCLIKNKKESAGTLLFFVAVEDMYEIIHNCHIKLEHRKTLAVCQVLSKEYANITRDVIDIYCKMCPFCQERKIISEERRQKAQLQRELNPVKHVPKKVENESSSDNETCNDLSNESRVRLSPKEKFEQKVFKLSETQSERSFVFSQERLEKIKNDVKGALAKQNKGLTSLEYRRLKTYEIFYSDGKELLVKKRKHPDDMLIYFTAIEDMYDTLRTLHLQLGHRRSLAMSKAVASKYANIPRAVLDIFLKYCLECRERRRIGMKRFDQPVLNNEEREDSTMSQENYANSTMVNDEEESEDSPPTKKTKTDENMAQPDFSQDCSDHDPLAFVAVDIKVELDEEFEDESRVEAVELSGCPPVNWERLVKLMEPVYEHKFRSCLNGGEMILSRTISHQGNTLLHFSCTSCPKEYFVDTNSG